MKTNILTSIITKRAAPYFLVVTLLPAMGITHVDPRLSEINKDGRKVYARRILGSKEYRRIASDADQWIILEKYILRKVRSALPNHTDLQTHAITNTIIKEANKFGFDPLFILAMIEQESGIRPNMRGTSGEIGLMQLLPKTARWIAKKHKIKYYTDKQLRDPVFNIKLGVRYLAYLHNQFPKAYLSVSAYNMGPKNVNKLLKKNKQPEVYFGHVLRRYKRFYAETQAVPRIETQTLIAAQ